MTEMYGYAPPSGIEILIAWLSELAGETRDYRPPGANVWPWRMVTRIPGGNGDRITDSGLYAVHTFHQTLALADQYAWETHRRILALGPPMTSQKTVVISTGTATVDRVEVEQAPVWVDYVDDGSIYRLVGRYLIDLRYVAAQ